VWELLPERVSPELRHLQAQLAAQLPYRQAAAILEEIMPQLATERWLSVNALEKRSTGKSITPVWFEPAERMVVGIDGAFVKFKARHTRPGQRHQFEILTGRVEASQRGGEAFALVRDLIRMQSGGCNHSPALRSWTRYGFEDSVGWRRWIVRGGRHLKRNSCISLMGMISRNPRGSLGKLEQHEVDALERRCGHGGIRNDQRVI
jgi:hypothetical protein